MTAMAAKDDAAPRSCLDCAHCVETQDGYSEYTPTGSIVACGKDLWPDTELTDDLTQAEEQEARASLVERAVACPQFAAGGGQWIGLAADD